MHSLNEHLKTKVNAVERVQDRLQQVQVNDFVSACFEGGQEKQLKTQTVNVPPSLATGGQPAEVPVPAGLFMPHQPLAIDQVTIQSNFKVSYTERVEHDKGVSLKGSFNAKGKSGFKIKLHVKAGQPAEGQQRLMQLLNKQLNHLKV